MLKAPSGDEKSPIVENPARRVDKNGLCKPPLMSNVAEATTHLMFKVPVMAKSIIAQKGK